MKEIAPNIYVSTDYPEVNVGFIARADGIIAVDAPTLPSDALEWQRRITETADAPILYTVLTDTHPHRLLCAGMLEAPIVASQAAYEHAGEYTSGFWRSVIRRLKRRFPEEKDALPNIDVRLPEILLTGDLTLHKGGSDVIVRSIEGNAPGNTWIDLREEGVIFLGDTLTVKTPPPMDETPDTKAWLKTLTTLRRPRFADLTFVPGRGPIGDQEDTRPLSECIRVARRRVRSLHRAQRPRDDVTEFVSELLTIFPIPGDEKDRFRRRVRNGLKRVYDELEPDKEDNG